MIQQTNKVTNKQIETFINYAEPWLRVEANKDTIMFDAVDKVFKRAKKKLERYQESLAQQRRLCAMTDPKTKKLLTSSLGNYEYTLEGADKLATAVSELMNKKVDIKACYVDNAPDSFAFETQNANGVLIMVTDYEVRSAFEGFVLYAKPEDVEEEEEELQETES